jgi:hypothetical protein
LKLRTANTSSQGQCKGSQLLFFLIFIKTYIDIEIEKRSIEKVLTHFFQDFVVGRYLKVARLLIPKSRKTARPKVCFKNYSKVFLLKQ